MNCIGGVMVSMLASSAVDGGFEPRSGQSKDYKIDSCCFPVKDAALRREKQRRVGSESGYCVRLGRHVYPLRLSFSELALNNPISVLV